MTGELTLVSLGPGSPDHRTAAADRAIADYERREGAAALQAAITRGQYTHPDGLFYGGRDVSWSNRLWRSLLRQHGDTATHLAVLDLHSGLGARGACENP